VAGKYGGVQLDSESRVVGFPGRSTPVTSYHYPGIQVVQRQVFEELPDNTPAESVREVYPRLMAQTPDAVRGCVFDATWRDIGTQGDYVATCAALAGDAAGNVIGPGAWVHPRASLTRTVVWAGGRVEADCQLSDCVVTDRSTVRAGTVAEGQVFL
jgi:NDP-sugar pyrophosphorylase family protein